MHIKNSQYKIFLVNLIYLVIFTILFIIRKNYEFLAYVGIVLGLGLLIVYTNNKVNYSNATLWWLSLWAFVHISGGGILIGGEKLYGMMIYEFSKTYSIFRYDQFAHVLGYFVAALLCYDILKPILKKNHNNWVRIGIIVIMASAGMGAVNEIIEFIASQLMQTGVGGYINNSVDLIANLIGACIGFFYIKKKERK